MRVSFPPIPATAGRPAGPAPAPEVPGRHHELVRLSYYMPGDWDPEEIRVKSDGQQVGDPTGYASWEQAVASLGQLTAGVAPAAAVIRSQQSPARFIGIGAISWNAPFAFERGEDLPATADEIELRDMRLVGLVDGARAHRLDAR